MRPHHHMIEGVRTGQPLLQPMPLVAVDQHRLGADAGQLQECDQQRRLVLAVAVAVAQRYFGRVRGVRVFAHVQADVTDLALHERHGAQQRALRVVAAQPQALRHLGGHLRLVECTRIQLRRPGRHRTPTAGGGHFDHAIRVHIVGRVFFFLHRRDIAGPDIQLRHPIERAHLPAKPRRADPPLQRHVGPIAHTYPALAQRHAVARFEHVVIAFAEHRIAATDGHAIVNAIAHAQIRQGDRQRQRTIEQAVLQPAFAPQSGVVRLRAHIDALAGAPDLQAVEFQLLVLRLVVDGNLPGFLQALGPLHGVAEPAVSLRHAAGQIDLVGHQFIAQPGSARHVTGNGICHHPARRRRHARRLVGPCRHDPGAGQQPHRAEDAAQASHHIPADQAPLLVKTH